MSEPLTDEQLEIPAGDLPPDSAPSPDVETGAAPESTEAAPSEPDYAALQTKLDEQNAKLEEMATRLRDTQTWGHHQAAVAAQKQAYLEAMQEREAAERQQREYWQSLQPPSLSDDEKQSILEDPALLEKKLKEFTTYGYNYAYRTFEQPMRQALAAAQVTARLAQRERVRAAREAREMASEHGISSTEFDTLIQEVNGAFDSMPDQYAAESLRTDPEMVLNAVNVMRTRRGGVPLKKKSPPPSLGAGSHQPSGGTPSVKDFRNDPSVQRLKAEFGGLELSPESLKEFMARRQAANRR